MFEDLKQQRLRGMSQKERSRLLVTVSLALVLGTVVFTYRGCSDATPPPAQIPDGVPPAPPRRTVDLGPLEGLRARGAEGVDLDREALDHLLSEIRAGAVDLAVHDVRAPAEANALPPAGSAGSAVEVEGVVRSLDSETYESARSPSLDRLWAFALEGDDAARVVVVHAGSSNEPESGKPRDAYLVGGNRTGDRLAEGDRVVVRGLYLQRKTGGNVGAVALGSPAAVVVGGEYRRLPPGPRKAAPVSLSEIDWSAVQDRSIKATKELELPAHFQVLAWARARGAEALARDFRSGAIRTRDYDRDAYLRWQADLDADSDSKAPDPRRWTNAARGQVFVHAGRLAVVDEESWGTVAPNPYGVDARWSVWIVSDHHHAFGSLRFHSPFEPTAFPGITGKDQRVIVRAVFVKNYTYVLGEGTRDAREVTAPYFVVLHMEPWGEIPKAPLWNNVFWYAGLALLTLGVLFYVVLIRGERKEAAAIEGHRLALRRRMRAHEAASGGPGPPPGDPNAGT